MGKRVKEWKQGKIDEEKMAQSVGPRGGAAAWEQQYA
jgi:hypothetical protein